MKRTFAYWPARIIFWVGIVTVGIMVVLVAAGALFSPCLSCARQATFGVPDGVLLTALAVAFAAVGLVWMVRIFRGPRDKPPAWRHRDRR
jgi:hypothetical protein